jgi:hypothetical protein
MWYAQLGSDWTVPAVDSAPQTAGSAFGAWVVKPIYGFPRLSRVKAANGVEVS